MVARYLRRRCALACLALVTSIGAYADSFTGPTLIDFEARGYSNYNVSIYADLVVGGSEYASAYASFGGIYGSSYSYIGEAGVIMHFENIHKVGGQWIADGVTVLEFSNATGQYEYRWYSNHALPSASWAEGSASCGGYTQTVRGDVNGYGSFTNSPPVAAIAVQGRSSGQVVPINYVATVHFSATDANGNLDGIRYNVWHPDSGYYDNNGGAYAPQWGSSNSTVTRSITLDRNGDWYFWTEAIDQSGATSTTPTWGSAFKLTVTSVVYCVPAYSPTFWNSNSYIKANNNCYNYANNKRTDSFAQPGRGCGSQFTSLTPTSLSNAAMCDGLEPTDAWSTSPVGKMKVALVIWPGNDYHWYRQDSNGRWSHKRGGTSATNLDSSGRIITNPQTCNRGPYTQFVGYFFTPASCTQGTGYANIY